MRIIYHDQTGRHLAVVAAALHLQLLGKNVSRWDLRQLPYFLNTRPTGTLLYIGLDSQGNEIYILGRKKSFPIICNAYLGLNRVFHLNQDLVFADVQPLSNWWLRVFDFLNQKSEEQILGAQLMYKGLGKAMPQLNLLVQEVRQRVKKGRELDESIL